MMKVQRDAWSWRGQSSVLPLLLFKNYQLFVWLPLVHKTVASSIRHQYLVVCNMKPFKPKGKTLPKPKDVANIVGMVRVKFITLFSRSSILTVIKTSLTSKFEKYKLRQH